ncbi:hypothetical protein F66182_7602 [Fusarium sp. NRRL 66182]|nr:hypothetical protein F66182_7602 [Fusarium sp. NRRL 66182]
MQQLRAAQDEVSVAWSRLWKAGKELLKATADKANRRVAQLEKKIDDIVSLLENQRKGLSPPTPQSPQEMQPRPQAYQEAVSTPSLIINSPSINLAREDGSTCAGSDFELFPGFSISHDVATRRLDVYRRDYLPHFPFVPIPGGITSHELHAESRLLFWVIVATVSPLEEKIQVEFKSWFRKYLAEHLVVLQEKSTDILQAILLFLAWHDFQFYGELQISTLIQLAVSLVIDLKLDKHPGAWFCGAKALLRDAWQSMGKPCPKVKVQTSADKRAVLGVYHITNVQVISCSLSRDMYSYFADSAHTSKRAEFESDLYLVALVRMQSMADRAFSFVPSLEYLDSTPTFRAVTAMALDNVHRELEAFSKSQPDTVKRTPGFWSHYNALVIRLYEPIIMMKPPGLSAADSLPSEPFQRSEYMWKCLESVRDTLEHHIAIPPAVCSVLPVTVTCILAFATITATRLVLAENLSDWSPAHARRRLQFQDILKRLSDQFEQVAGEAQRLDRRRVMEDGSNIFIKSCFKVRWIRQWYLSKIPQGEQQEMQPLQEAATPSSVLQSNPDWAANFQFDDEFWADLMSSYDVETFQQSLATVTAG